MRPVVTILRPLVIVILSIIISVVILGRIAALLQTD